MIESWTKFWKLVNRLLGFGETAIDTGEVWLTNAAEEFKKEAAKQSTKPSKATKPSA
jgi:hypothetical protein